MNSNSVEQAGKLLHKNLKNRPVKEKTVLLGFGSLFSQEKTGVKDWAGQQHTHTATENYYQLLLLLSFLLRMTVIKL